MIRFAFLFFALSLSAAASPIDRTSCRLPADQGAGSFFGSWANLPIAIALDAEFYRQNQGRDAAQLKRAINTWNKWAKLKGKVAFVLVDNGVGEEIPELTDCSQSSYTAARSNYVGVWKITSEGAGKNQRFSCPIGADGNPGKLLANNLHEQTDWTVQNGHIQAASVLLNFDTGFKSGQPSADLESTFLHSLGHVLGLLHSCSGSTDDHLDSTTAPACSAAPEEYRKAVMFPYLSNGETRTKLSQNDFDRINCLY